VSAVGEARTASHGTFSIVRELPYPPSPLALKPAT
jgi:hypothetical protein